jgi:hypothetical protein
MRLLCYRTSAPMPVQEQLWLCSEYVHALAIAGYAEFYIREDRLSFALILDPLMTRVKQKDLII